MARYKRGEAKQYIDGKTVTEAAEERIRHCYDRFDEIVVSFSGGKDSTAVLNMVIKVATELDRLPVRVDFFDEEVITPDTYEYVNRVRQRPEVDMNWYCLPFKHAHGCSLRKKEWKTFDPKDEDKWVRPMPDWAISEHPRFKLGMSFQDFGEVKYPEELGMVCVLTGIRTDESINRLRSIVNNRSNLSQKGESWITLRAKSGNTYFATPIYDWSSHDVWILVREWGLDYNKTYDKYNMTELEGQLAVQRISQAFGEQPIRKLWTWKVMYPEMWDAMLRRLPGVATAYRYANTELFGVGTADKPEKLSWQEYTNVVIGYDADVKARNAVRKSINGLLRSHARKTDDPVPEESPHPLSGLSWRGLCQLAMRRETKGRFASNFENKAIQKQDQLGITYEQAKQQYGKRSN